jgi:3-oxoacyl-[acyl-carrier-protein] synthase II
VANLVEKGYKKISPFFIPYAITNMGGALLAIDTGFMGPNYSISTACATANYAYVSAANHIRNGEADLMVVGGSEAPIIPVGLGGFVACRALSTRNDEPQKASRCGRLGARGSGGRRGAGAGAGGGGCRRSVQQN